MNKIFIILLLSPLFCMAQYRSERVHENPSSSVANNTGYRYHWGKETSAGYILLDSFSESNYSGNYELYSAGMHFCGQTFTNENQVILTSCKFYLSKQDGVAADMIAHIYAHTGIYGTTGKPTGTILASSSPISAEFLSGTYELVEFEFTGENRIILNAETYYCITLEYTGTARLNVAADSEAPDHLGNSFFSNNGSTWTAYSDFDICFYIYGQ